MERTKIIILKMINHFEESERDNTREIIYEILVSKFLEQRELSMNKALKCAKDIENTIYIFSKNDNRIYLYKRYEIMLLLLNNNDMIYY